MVNRYYIIEYKEGLPVSISISDSQPLDTFDITKAILELIGGANE